MFVPIAAHLPRAPCHPPRARVPRDAAGGSSPTRRRRRRRCARSSRPFTQFLPHPFPTRRAPWTMRPHTPDSTPSSILRPLRRARGNLLQAGGAAPLARALRKARRRAPPCGGVRRGRGPSGAHARAGALPPPVPPRASSPPPPRPGEPRVRAPAGGARDVPAAAAACACPREMCGKAARSEPTAPRALRPGAAIPRAASLAQWRHAMAMAIAWPWPCPRHCF